MKEPEGFAEFWTLWRPHRRHTDGRGNARDTYRKHILNGAEIEEINQGAEWYLSRLKDADKPYIPLASTWMNKEAYADWYAEKQEYEARQAARAQEQGNVTVFQPKGQTAFLRKHTPTASQKQRNG